MKTCFSSFWGFAKCPMIPVAPNVLNIMLAVSSRSADHSLPVVSAAAPPPLARPAMLHLNHDTWAAIGQYLDPVSVYQLSSTCKDLHSDISCNPTLWRVLALKRWPLLAWETNADTVCDWHGLYKASHAACCQLATARPWSLSIPRRTRTPPRIAHLLLSHTLSPARSDCGSTNWQSSTFVAAAVNSSVRFTKWTARADISKPFAASLPLGQGNCAEPCCQQWCSDGHHEVPISTMLEVPTSSTSPGYATGLMDGTIKLWTPFKTTSSNSSSSSSSSTSRRAGGGRQAPEANPIRPSRTLTGHTDQILSLTCLTPTQQQQQHSVLVSGSADKTIRLWSLACVQQPCGSSSSGGGGGGGGSGGGGVGSGRQGGQKHKQQASGSPLLGTLRGHSSAVSSVLAWPAVAADSTSAEAPGSSSSSSSSSGVLSGGQDGRVKLWVVDEGRRGCVVTWRLPGSCQQLLGGLDMPGCAAARLDRRLVVLDTRVPPAGSAVTQGELTFPWAKGISCAAVRGNVVAAGGREGVRAWDLRRGDSNSDDTGAASSSRGSSSARASLLLSGSLPHVSALHLDSVKLVAASDRARLHSAAGIAVWSLPSGNKAELYSSLLSGICLHPTAQPYQKLGAALGPFTIDAFEHLILQLPEKQAAEAEAIFYADADEGFATEDDFWGGSGSYASSDAESGSTESVKAAATAGSGRDSGSTRWKGCIEPGVAALSVQGPVIACVDSLGNFLLRDFTAGLPRPELVQAFTAPAPAAGSKQLDGGAALGPGSGTSEAAAAAAVKEMSRLKFWRQ